MINMSKWKELGFTEDDRKEVDLLKKGLADSKPKISDGMPLAPSKEETISILSSCAAMLGFEYSETT